MSVDLPTPPLPLATASTRVSAVERDPLRALGDAAAQALGQRGPLVGRHHVELERDALDALDRPEHVAAPAPGSSSRSGHPAIVSAIAIDDVAAVDPHVAHHVELGHGTPQLGVDHAPERAHDLFARRRHHGRA